MPVLAQHRSSADVGINIVGAPVPTPLTEGKHVFISYELGDVSAFPSSYSGGPERAYSEFYTAIKNWGRYQIVLDPKDADIILAIRFVEPPAALAQIRLGILDGKTHTSLWGFVEQIDAAFRKKNRDAAFSETVDQLAADLKSLLATTPAAAQAAPQP